MILYKGDKIKQVKEIVGFNKVGDIFEITSIQDNVIFFKSSYGVGVMSYDDCEKYFSKYQDETWSNWEKMKMFDVDFEYRQKGNKIQCKFPNGIKTQARCHEEDKFNLELGLYICKLRYNKEMAIREVEKINNKLSCF